MRLYISDLDGTLLNSNKEISAYTKAAINALAASGGHFSVATARTAASVLKILSGVNIDMPVILMNGVMIYDMRTGKYIKVEALTEQTAAGVTDIMKKNGITGFMYAVSGESFVTYYERLATKAMCDFYTERVERYGKCFTRIDDFIIKTKDNEIIYFMLLDEKSALTKIAGEVRMLSGLNVVMYKDIYSEDLWYLEIYSINASKRRAAEYIKSMYDFERVIGFGDNINDIPLIDACDEFYAVAGAVGQLKEKAAGVIGDNDSDGVARFISEKEGLVMEGGGNG